MSKIELLNIDCMQYMAGLKDNAFDLAIVDPPYGIGDTWSKSRRDRFYKNGKLYQYQNKEAPSKDYFKQLRRISKNQIIWGGNYFTKDLKSTNAWVVWDKMRNADATYMSEVELAWTSFNKVMRIVQYQWNGAKKCEITEKIHPHQKPIQLYKWLLIKYAKEGNTIFDSHGGSMPLAIASYDLGFDCTICEIDKDYYNASVKRFEQHKSQTKLQFHIEKPKHEYKQLSII